MPNEPKLTGAMEESLVERLCYSGPFRADKANIFYREWFCAGRAEQIPQAATI